MSSFLFRASHSLAKRKLLLQIDESLKNLKLANVSEIAEFQEIIKEKGFELQVDKTSEKVLVQKTTPIGKLSLLSQINPVPDMSEDLKTVLNPKNLKEIDDFLESSKNKRKRFLPVPVTVSLEAADKVMVTEIMTLHGNAILRSMTVLDAQGFCLKDYSEYPGFKPLLEKNLKIENYFKSWLNNIGVDQDVLRGLVDFSDFHYNYMSKKWLEKVRKLIL